MSKAPILSVENLNKTYCNNNIAANEVISNLSLTVEKNAFLCILGPSGCGKSTLLRCIAGMETYSGQIMLNGESISKPGMDRIMVFQDFNQLFPWKTISQNVKYPLKLTKKYSQKALDSIAQEYLTKVGLWNYRDYYPHQLSGGMKQRAAIARALILKPVLMLMDEPFASLDAITRNHLQKELLQITSNEDITVLFVTHNIQEALVLSTQVIVMSAGGEIALNDPNLLEKPVKPTTSGYAEKWDRYNDSLKGL